MARPICEIASDIKKDWLRPSPYALPYLNAMLEVSLPTDMYGADDGQTIVLYFLGNASTYRTPKAKEYKAELNAIIKRARSL